MNKRNAGFWIRFAAQLLDGLVLMIPAGILYFLITGGEKASDSERDVVRNILTMGYTVLLPVFWNGQTIGKRICKIRIRKLDGTSPGIGSLLIRNGLCLLLYSYTFGIAFLISIVMVIVRKDRRAIHDFASGTEVVHDYP
ncbi:putative RDD family membrane protein YckC [Paenibacillus forsythiae]|uniref:RDD family membrane protein YckC n=1 Tax=Paenibacillus forsythiae TaxID=365616 RepID=A0ABU3HCS1_9BACL|nr:RDD family protein [Paenibacillus forsythiae]MDT3428613.1 putative RDD family membrane protein YckC [Paenibacillus forsythiae]